MDKSDPSALSQDFNRTAVSFLTGKAGIDLVIAKYSILMGYKAESQEDRQDLTTSLYLSGLRWIETKRKTDIYVGGGVLNNATTLLSRLTEADCLPCLPRGAPAQLADLGLALLQAAEGSRSKGEEVDSDTRKCLVKIAEQTLAAANKIKTYQDTLPAAAETPAKKNDERLSL